jgi:DNA-binding NarL/FixJ family response regulator
MVKWVLIAEDHTLTREALCDLFSSQEDFEVCGDAENGQEAIEMAEVLCPDLIVLDLSMPVMNGIEAAGALRQLMPETPIIVFSEYSDVFSEREAGSEGISAFVSKTEPVSVLLDKARAVLYHTAGGCVSPSNQRKEQGHVHARS